MEPQELFAAIRAGGYELVRDALRSHPWWAEMVNPQKDAWDECRPLHCAAKHGHLDLVKLLVEAGAEIYSNPMTTYPAVMVAAWNKRSEVVSYFLDEIPDRAVGTNKLGVTLNLAARQGWVDKVRQHLALDPLAVHQRGSIGDTPLHWPAHNGHTEIVSLLLDAGAAIEADALGCYGGKPLHWASKHEPATVELLLSRGAHVNARNLWHPASGTTPLITNACQPQDCAEVTELLLAAGADMRAKDSEGKTALEHAFEQKLVRIPEVLLRHGASL